MSVRTLAGKRAQPTAHRQLFHAFKYVCSIAIIDEGYREGLERSRMKSDRTPPMQGVWELHDERNQWVRNLAVGVNIEMSGEMKDDSPTSPPYPHLRNGISSDALSDARSHTECSLICRRELSRPMSLHFQLQRSSKHLRAYLGDADRIHDGTSARWLRISADASQVHLPRK